MKIKFITLVIILSLLSSCTFSIKENENDEKDIYTKHEYRNDDNILIGTSTYVNGKRHGQEVGYWETGELYFVGEYRNGKKNGIWVYTDEKGEVFRIEKYENGVKQLNY